MFTQVRSANRKDNVDIRDLRGSRDTQPIPVAKKSRMRGTIELSKLPFVAGTAGQAADVEGA